MAGSHTAKGVSTGGETLQLDVIFPNENIRRFEFGAADTTLHEVKTRIFAAYHAESGTSTNLQLLLADTKEQLRNNLAPLGSCHPEIFKVMSERKQAPPRVVLRLEPCAVRRGSQIVRHIDDLLALTQKMSEKDAPTATLGRRFAHSNGSNNDDDILNSFDSLLDTEALEQQLASMIDGGVASGGKKVPNAGGNDSFSSLSGVPDPSLLENVPPVGSDTPRRYIEVETISLSHDTPPPTSTPASAPVASTAVSTPAKPTSTSNSIPNGVIMTSHASFSPLSLSQFKSTPSAAPAPTSSSGNEHGKLVKSLSTPNLQTVMSINATVPTRTLAASSSPAPPSSITPATGSAASAKSSSTTPTSTTTTLPLPQTRGRVTSMMPPLIARGPPGPIGKNSANAGNGNDASSPGASASTGSSESAGSRRTKHRSAAMLRDTLSDKTAAIKTQEASSSSTPPQSPRTQQQQQQQTFMFGRISDKKKAMEAEMKRSASGTLTTIPESSPSAPTANHSPSSSLSSPSPPQSEPETRDEKAPGMPQRRITEERIDVGMLPSSSLPSLTSGSGSSSAISAAVRRTASIDESLPSSSPRTSSRTSSPSPLPPQTQLVTPIVVEELLPEVRPHPAESMRRANPRGAHPVFTVAARSSSALALDDSSSSSSSDSENDVNAAKHSGTNSRSNSTQEIPVVQLKAGATATQAESSSSGDTSSTHPTGRHHTTEGEENPLLSPTPAASNASIASARPSSPSPVNVTTPATTNHGRPIGAISRQTITGPVSRHKTGGAARHTRDPSSGGSPSFASSPSSSSSNKKDKKRFRRAKKRGHDDEMLRKRLNYGEYKINVEGTAMVRTELPVLDTGSPWMAAKPVVFDDDNDGYDDSSAGGGVTCKNTSKARISVERMSLMRQAPYFEMNSEDLANYRLAHDLQSPIMQEVLADRKLPINIAVHLANTKYRVLLECKGIDSLKSIKERAFSNLRLTLSSGSASSLLQDASEYTLELTDTGIFFAEEDRTLNHYWITPMGAHVEHFTLSPKSRIAQVRTLSDEVSGILESTALLPYWQPGDTEQTHFRKNMSRNTIVRTAQVLQATAITRAPVPPDFPPQIQVMVFYDPHTAKAFMVSPDTRVSFLVAESAKRNLNAPLDPDTVMLRVAGLSEYVLEDVPMHRIEYVRRCIQRRKRIQFLLTPKQEARIPVKLPEEGSTTTTTTNEDGSTTTTANDNGTMSDDAFAALVAALTQQQQPPSQTLDPVSSVILAGRTTSVGIGNLAQQYTHLKPRSKARFLKSSQNRELLFYASKRPNTLPLWSIKRAFELRIEGVESLQVVTDAGKIITSSLPSSVLFFEVGLFFSGEPLAAMRYTRPVPFSLNPTWDQVIVFESTCLCNIPRETRLCLTLYARDPKGNETPLAWIGMNLFDYHDILKSGPADYYLWPNDKANPIGVSGSSQAMKEKAANKLKIELEPASLPISYTDIMTIPRMTQVVQETPSELLVPEMEYLVSQDPLWRPNEAEKELLWRYRYWVRDTYPQRLAVVALSVPWTDPLQVQEMYNLLQQWPRLDAEVALELLDARYADFKIRSFAVTALEDMTDETLELYLLQLVQVLKYEYSHYSALAQFLVDRACENEVKIGIPLFWYLKAELPTPETSERFGLILEAFLMNCSPRFRSDILNQMVVIDIFKDLATQLRNFPLAKRTDVLRELLLDVRFPDTFTLPLNPTLIISGTVDVKRCRCFDSAKAPLLVCFKSADPVTPLDDVLIIFKAGDDLRQDALTVQMLLIMDQIWKAAGLDLHLTPYRVSVTSENHGLIEVVPDSTTTAKIQKEAGGASAAFKQTPLANWLKGHNTKEAELSGAVDNFVLSLAGYCVATYVMGIGDRHNDNIMIDKHGHIFHIDFGHFLGNFKSFAGLKRERAPFVLTPEFAFVMGGKDSDRFRYFVRLCCRAYNLVRRNSNLIINLFAMMLSTGIPELRGDQDLLYLQDALASDLTDEESAQVFTELIYDSLSSLATRANFAIHILAH